MPAKLQADKGPPFKDGIQITERGAALVRGRLALLKLKNGQAVENRFFICLKDNAGKMYTIDKDENKLLEGI